jgi:thioredoxin 1
MILRDKVLLFSQAGALPEAALEDVIRQVRELDMEKVRAEIAAQEKKAQTA